MAATAPPEDESSASRQLEYQMRPQSFPQPLQSYQQQPVYQPQQQQQAFPVPSGGFPLQPYPTQFGPQFYEPMVRSSLQTVHVGHQLPPPQAYGRPRVAPPYQPPPPYPRQYGAALPPSQPAAPASVFVPPPGSVPNNSQCCRKMFKTIIIMAVISVIAGIIFYFIYAKTKKH